MTFENKASRILTVPVIVKARTPQGQGNKETPKAEWKIETKIETLTTSVPYNRVQEENPYLLKGVEQVKVVGKEGLETITYEVTYANGKEKGRREVRREVTTPAVDEVIEIGTKKVISDAKVEVKIETLTTSIPYNRVQEENPYLLKGVEQVKVAGKEGLETITYEVTYADGKETGRSEVRREVTTPVVDEVIEIGSKKLVSNHSKHVPLPQAYPQNQLTNSQLPRTGGSIGKTGLVSGVLTLGLAFLSFSGKCKKIG